MDGKIFVLGLDCAPPKILYNDLRGELENIESLMTYKYELPSTHPPITIPAWISMATGKTPGELGLYGFRHRRLGSYNEMYIANSRMVRARTVWDVMGRQGKRSIVVGVPPTYPPKPIRGWMITDFITPGPDKNYTWPPNLKREVENLLGHPYIFDVEFRSHDKEKIKRGLWRMTEAQFKVLEHLVKTREWDFLFYVLIGTDRAHHAFWKFYDPDHPKYPGPNKYEDVIPEYYRLVDKLLGDLLQHVPRGTEFIVVSDHGAKPMKGAFAVNQWLMEEELLHLKKKPDKPGADLRPDMIDWEKTKAWGWGGYYARIFLNVKGREPNGVIDPEEYEGFIEDLKKKIKEIRGPNGERWETKVYTPRELYPITNGDPPDLMVYFDDLYWRSAGTIGWPSMYLEENDRGPDDAVHDWIGIFATTIKHHRRPANVTEVFTKGVALLTNTG
ncbi:MAG: alkaline phosphatase family protein [Desulfurococcales archaeon]|nr:alkaline phosphatase family protein [Desulfurococcales archaeon]